MAGIALCTVSFSAFAAQLRIIQTNFAGDTIHIIDPATNKVVGKIEGTEATHGITVAPDGSRIYISEEADFTVDVIDGKTLKIVKKIPLSGNPNLIDITPDGKSIYVAIALTYNDLSAFPKVQANGTGGVDVIDTVSLTKVKTIAMKGGVHDLNVTPDGKFVIVGNARGGKANVMTVVDTKTNDIAWTMPMDPAPSPMAVSKNPDGSTKSIFTQNGRDNGFQVVDFATRKITNTVKLPDITDRAQVPLRTAGGIARHHGHPGSEDPVGQQQVQQRPLFVLTPRFEALGSRPAWRQGAGWMTITPDGKTAYVANEHTNDTSVVDIKSMKETARIPVGFAPARNIVWMAP